jgi:glutathione peroxidase
MVVAYLSAMNRRTFLAAAFSGGVLVPPAWAQRRRFAHIFSFESIAGGPLPLSAYAGRVLLVVNTASQCGYTPQYDGLQALWARYRSRGLTVIGVPSNDFGGQEPAGNRQIQEFCRINFGVDFPLAARTPVTGRQAHPFYAWAQTQLGDAGRPRWNFHKILIGRDGRAIAGFPSAVEPSAPALLSALERALSG